MVHMKNNYNIYLFLEIKYLLILSCFKVKTCRLLLCLFSSCTLHCPGWRRLLATNDDSSFLPLFSDGVCIYCSYSCEGAGWNILGKVESSLGIFHSGKMPLLIWKRRGTRFRGCVLDTIKGKWWENVLGFFR